MQPENTSLPKNSQPVNRLTKKKYSTPLPLSVEEIEYLKAKRFIEEWDIIRFFGISRSSLYRRIKKGELQPSRLGGKKIFDLQDIFHQLEKTKGKGK